MSAKSSEAEPVLVARHLVEGGTILEITINRPEVHNAVNGAAAKLLLDAWRLFRDDDSLCVAVLRGAGEQAFCSGADLTALGSLAKIGASRDKIAASVEQGTGPMGGTRIVQAKPVITVSQGCTYAGGLELFCHGHIRIAEPQATFSVACRRWGVLLVDGGTVYLPRLVGWGAALPLIITGQRISAERAFQVGLVWELVPEGTGLERAMSMARQICALPRDAMLADLNSALAGWHLPLDAALDLEARNLHPVMASDSTRRGVADFQAGKRFWFT
jgi:enoyl-CoA hydratase